MLISLGCCISFTDETKKNTLNSTGGQTALYWIIRNTPENVSFFIDSNQSKIINNPNLGK
jgi:hypothetical protein